MQQDPRQAFIALLHAASSSNIRLNRTKVAKLLYLADLEAVKQGRNLFTGYVWRWRHHGPYDNALLAVERSLAAEGAIDSTPTTNYYGSTEYRIEPRDLPALHIDQVFREIIEGVVERYGRLSAGSLRDLTYQTPPMEDAVADGANEQVLDFSDVQPAPKISATLRHLRDVVRAAGPQDDDEGASEDLVADIERFAPARALANRELLD